MNKITYPEKHKQIVAELLGGKFILESASFFPIVQGHVNFYRDFFRESYGYELNTQNNYFFLTSKDTQEETSRDLILFLALFAYEMHNEQRDFVKEIKEKVFEVGEIERMLRVSSKYDDIIKGTKAEDLPKFINTWENRHLLSFVDKKKSKIRFNDPIHTFLRVAADLSQSHLQEEEQRA